MDDLGDGPDVSGILQSRFIVPATAATTFVVDSLSVSPTGAWGFRKMRSAYSGYACRIIRDTDSATLDVGFSGEHLDTSAITSFIGSNSADLGTLYDQVGSDNLTCSGWKIVISGATVTFNSRLVAQSPMTTSAMSSASAMSTVKKANTFNCVHRVDASGGSSAVVTGASTPSGSDRYNIHAPYAAGDTYYDVGNNAAGRINGAIDWSTTGHVGVFRSDGTSQMDVWQDGVSKITSGSATPADNTSAILLNYMNDISGRVAEFMIWKTSAISSGDRSALEANQKSYWGTP